MEAAAHNAAQFIRGRAATVSGLAWESKSPTDFVSEVDTGAERIIRDLLAPGPRRSFLVDGSFVEFDVRVVGEEFSPGGALDRDGVTFVVDPLDGTTNFLHGYPWYAVSIGAMVGGELAGGLVLNVPTGELFTAWRGGGAYRDGKPIRVSTNADPRRALIGTGFPFKNLDLLDRYQRQFAALAGRTAGMRRAGAAALDLCDVACGRFDAFWELNLAPWDVAAGSLLITEAGGLVGNYTGDSDFLHVGEVVAGNPKIYAQMVPILSRYSRTRQQAA